MFSTYLAPHLSPPPSLFLLSPSSSRLCCFLLHTLVLIHFPQLVGVYLTFASFFSSSLISPAFLQVIAIVAELIEPSESRSDSLRCLALSLLNYGCTTCCHHFLVSYTSWTLAVLLSFQLAELCSLPLSLSPSPFPPFSVLFPSCSHSICSLSIFSSSLSMLDLFHSHHPFLLSHPRDSPFKLPALEIFADPNRQACRR